MEPITPVNSNTPPVLLTAVASNHQNQAFQDLISGLLGINVTPDSKSSESANEAAIQAAIQTQDKLEALEQQLSFALGNAQSARIAMTGGPKDLNGLPGTAQQEYYFWNLQAEHLEAETGPLNNL